MAVERAERIARHVGAWFMYWLCDGAMRIAVALDPSEETAETSHPDEAVIPLSYNGHNVVT